MSAGIPGRRLVRIGKLRRVMVCAPGLAHERLTRIGRRTAL